MTDRIVVIQTTYERKHKFQNDRIKNLSDNKSKKKLSILTDPKTNYQGRFIDGLMKAGATKENAEEFWTQLLDFASYAFNKSHAAAYAYVAYMTAWLKYHYPAEYMCSVMTRSDWKKIPELLSECRSFGLRIAPPDINKSREGFINDDKTILFGFNDVKGVGNAGDLIIADRNANGKYDSFRGFIERMQTSDVITRAVSKSVCEALIKAGAFDGFYGGNRAAYLAGLEECIAMEKKVVAKKKQLEANRIALDEAIAAELPEKELKKRTRSVTNAEKALLKLQDMFNGYSFPREAEDESQKLKDEYECLGAYLSGHPLKAYESGIAKVKKAKKIYTEIADLDDSGNATICCIVQSMDIKSRKQDGKKFCIMNVFDQSSEIEVKCFTAAYDKYVELIKEGAALTITGWISVDEDFGTKSLNVKEVEVLLPETNESVFLIGTTLLDYQKNAEEIMKYSSFKGLPLYFYESFTKQIHRVKINVSRDILDATFNGVVVRLNKT